MRVFVTGATGFIGSAVVKELISAGHEVVGLARSEASGQALRAMGAQAFVGSIENPEDLREGAKGANGAIHLAFFHQITHKSLPTRLRVILGGSPGAIVSRFTKAAVAADTRAITTLGTALTGSDRILVTAFPTMALRSGRLATEEDAPYAGSPGAGRIPSQEAVLALASNGVRSSVVRLPPVVHDREKQGLISRMTEIAKKKRVSAYIGNGTNRWPSVHRLDAAHLFRLALEHGSAGASYHAVAEEGVPVRLLAEAIGQRLRLPVIAKSSREAAKVFTWLTPFLEADNPVSSKLTQQRLGWSPAQPGILSDLLAT